MDIFSKAFAQEQDASDKLAHFRGKFIQKEENLIYLDGNSLGMLPSASPAFINEVVEEEWGRGLIRSWNHGWYTRAQEAARKLAPLIGAQEDEVIITDSTSVNLFKLAYAALKLQEGRRGIVSDELNFPSDIYVLQGLVKMFGNQHTLRLAKTTDGIGVSLDELDYQLRNDTALLSLSHVVFKSAFMYDMKKVTQLAHEHGAMMLWDLSHAAGSVPLDLNACNADLAIGCTYKYLNGGPGATAFLYVRKDLQEKLESPIWGWFGQHQPFDFNLNYKPAEGIARFLAGTPPLLSLSAILPALDLLNEAGMDNLRQKSLTQTNYLIDLFRHYLQPQGFELGSPEQEHERGSHVSLRHPEAYRICKALISPEVGEKVIIPDFREPDNIRLGIAPLYNTFIEVFEAVQQLKYIVENKRYEDFRREKENVT